MGPLRPKLSGETPKQYQVSPKTAPTKAALPQSGASFVCGRGVVDLETSTIDVDFPSHHGSSGRSQRFPTASMGCQSLKVHHSPKADPASVVASPDVPDLHDGSAGELEGAFAANGAWRAGGAWRGRVAQCESCSRRLSAGCRVGLAGFQLMTSASLYKIVRQLRIGSWVGGLGPRA